MLPGSNPHGWSRCRTVGRRIGPRVGALPATKPRTEGFACIEGSPNGDPGPAGERAAGAVRSLLLAVAQP